MSKIFNPKISKGPWKLDGNINDCSKSTDLYSKSINICEPVCVIPHDDVTDRGYKEVNQNVKAILAIPEMLCVIKKSRALIKSRNFQGVCDEEIELENALKKLDKIHGDGSMSLKYWRVGK